MVLSYDLCIIVQTQSSTINAEGALISGT